MARGSTGTEIFMGLRWELGKLLEEHSDLPAEFEARRLYKLIDRALEENG